MVGEIDQSEGDELRATDAKLFRLCQEFDKHVVRFDEHERRETETFGRILKAQEQNTVVIGELTGQVTALVENTAGVVQLHQDLQGTARLGKKFQNFMIWLLKWGAIGAGIAAGLMWVIEKLQP